MQTLAAVLGVLLLIFMGRYFAIFLSDAAAGEISGAAVVDLLLLRTLSAMNMMLPFALYIAVLLAFGRLYKDNEMTALAASGVSIPRVLLSISGLAVLISVVVALIALWLSPWAEEKRESVREVSEAASEIEGVLPGQFNQMSGHPDSVFYVEKFSEDRKLMQNIFVQIETKGELDILSANRAHHYRDEETGDQYLVLTEGFRYRGLPGKQTFTIQQYEKNAFRITAPSSFNKHRKRRAVPTSQLLDSAKPADVAELQWRISMPMSALLLALLGVLISKTNPRQGRFAKLFVAILVYIIYNNTMSIARSWVEQNKIPSEIGLWWVHFLLLFVVMVLFVRQSGTTTTRVAR